MKKTYVPQEGKENQISTFIAENKKKLFIALAVFIFLLLLVLGLSKVLSRNNTLSAEELRTLADEHVPASAMYQSSELSEGDYTFFYMDPKEEKSFRLVLKEDGELLRLEERAQIKEVNQKLEYQEEEIRELFRSAFPKAKISSIHLNEEDGELIYAIHYEEEGYTGYASYGAKSAKLLHRRLRKGERIVLAVGEENSVLQEELASHEEYLNLEEIANLAKEQIPEGEIESIDFVSETDEEEAKYIVYMKRGDVSYDLSLKAKGGRLLSLSMQNLAKLQADSSTASSHERNVLLDEEEKLSSSEEGTNTEMATSYRGELQIVRGKNDENQDEDAKDQADAKETSMLKSPTTTRAQTSTTSTSSTTKETTTSVQTTQTTRSTTQATTRATTRASTTQASTRATTQSTTVAPTSTQRTSSLTANEAKAIAAKHAGINVSYFTAYWEEDDGIYYWEVEAEVGDIDYEYEIDPRSGKILYYEID